MQLQLKGDGPSAVASNHVAAMQVTKGLPTFPPVSIWTSAPELELALVCRPLEQSSKQVEDGW